MKVNLGNIVLMIGLNNLKRNNIMKQTAVEWLLTYLPQIDYGNDPYYRDIIEQAKEMHKQEIIKAYGIENN